MFFDSHTNVSACDVRNACDKNSLCFQNVVMAWSIAECPFLKLLYMWSVSNRSHKFVKKKENDHSYMNNIPKGLLFPHIRQPDRHTNTTNRLRTMVSHLADKIIIHVVRFNAFYFLMVFWILFLSEQKRFCAYRKWWPKPLEFTLFFRIACFVAITHKRNSKKYVGESPE